MKSLSAGLCAVIVASALPRQTGIAATSCDSLASLSLPQATITSAQLVAAGAFRPPTAAPAGGEAFKNLPPFCRVAATLRPSQDSDITIEVWLPASGWNGKFQAVGNGGWAGTISYPAMSRALEHGYATSSTDTGHAGASASFALGHPEKLADYAYRSEHEMTVQAKAIIDRFYGSAPTRSYWNGCSTGGRQALTEAQRFPDDYDGIIAGAAANPKTALDSWRISMAQAMFKDQASVIPVSKFPMIHQAVLDVCDAIDGLKDGLIDDPTRCHFDPKVLECKSGDGPACLTAAQVTAARVVMSPAKNRTTGAEIFPGFEPGTELGWTRMLSGPDPYGTAVDQFKYIVFGNPNWDWRTFDLERDVAAAEKKSQGTLSSIDPNLTAFARHGGKLLMYHGWSDQDIAPKASINFYRRTLEATKTPPANADWLRLFMVPGMGHCGGGEGPNTFDMMTALEPWVERGTAPERVVATHSTAGKVDRSRPLCAYPMVARHTGTGSIDEAANFVCKSADPVSGYQEVKDWPKLPSGVQLGEAAGVAVDMNGHVFIFHRPGRGFDTAATAKLTEPPVLEVDADTGTLIHSWGADTFLVPHGITIDRDNNVFLTDVGLQQVFKFTHDGKPLITLGEPRVGAWDATHFNEPTDIQIRPDGTFYVSDGYVNSRVAMFDRNGKWTGEWGRKGAGPGEFSNPHGITFVPGSTDVLVADRENSRLQLFDRTGVFKKQWTGVKDAQTTGRVFSVAADPAGFYYVGIRRADYDTEHTGVLKLDRDWNIVTSIGFGRPGDPVFNAVHDIAVGRDGSIYVAETRTKRVVKVRPR